MNRSEIDSLIRKVDMPAIVKKVDWEISHDYDGDEIIKIGIHIPKSDDATEKQIAEIISAQKKIDALLSHVPNSLLTYFNILTDMPNKTAASKKKLLRMASIHHDLLDQAKHLAALDKKRPKQVNLRRAVSVSYYALFHFLVTQAVDNVASSKSQSVKNQLRRGFAHKEMKNVCKEYAAATGNPPAQLNKNISALCKTAIPIQIKTISKVFCEVQEARHLADYDMGARFSKTQVIAFGVQRPLGA